MKWLIGAVAIGTLAFGGSVALADPPADKVTICHRDAAVKKPYVQIEVALSSVDGDTGNDNGQGDHFAEHTGPVWTTANVQGDSWGDIIPPAAGHNGLNWTAAGQAIYNNGCQPVTPPTTPTTAPPTTPTTEPPTPPTNPPSPPGPPGPPAPPGPPGGEPTGSSVPPSPPAPVTVAPQTTG